MIVQLTMVDVMKFNGWIQTVAAMVVVFMDFGVFRQVWTKFLVQAGHALPSLVDRTQVNLVNPSIAVTETMRHQFQENQERGVGQKCRLVTNPDPGPLSLQIP